MNREALTTRSGIHGLTVVTYKVSQFVIRIVRVSVLAGRTRRGSMTDRCPDMFGHAQKKRSCDVSVLCIMRGHRLVVQLFDG